MRSRRRRPAPPTARFIVLLLLANGSRLASVEGPSVLRRVRETAPNGQSSDKVGGRDDFLAVRPVVYRRSEARQQSRTRIPECSCDILVPGP